MASSDVRETQRPPARAGSVFVGCKLPHGLKLQITEEREERENVFGGGTRTFKIHRRTDQVIKLHGIALAPGQVPTWPIVAGAAITKVPAQFWETWLEQNKTSHIVRNRLVFAASAMEGARSIAREMRGEKTGMEPINTDPKAKDPRMKGIKTIEKDDAPEEEFEE